MQYNVFVGKPDNPGKGDMVTVAAVSEKSAIAKAIAKVEADIGATGLVAHRVEVTADVTPELTPEQNAELWRFENAPDGI